MTAALELPTIVVWIPVAILGALVTFYVLRAWRQDRSRAMAALAVGFAFLSIVPAGMWFMILFTTDDWYAASFMCTAVMAGGLGAVVYALKTRFGGNVGA
ncbi:MAG TPA: hypothetical protein VFF67_04625 [Thermoplasmata archaeon]|nr:hypothetical protein [Thermoplasmata archaeon]